MWKTCQLNTRVNILSDYILQIAASMLQAACNCALVARSTRQKTSYATVCRDASVTSSPRPAPCPLPHTRRPRTTEPLTEF